MPVRYLHKRRAFMLAVLSAASIIYIYDISGYSSKGVGLSSVTIPAKHVKQKEISTKNGKSEAHRFLNNTDTILKRNKVKDGEVPIILLYEQHPTFWFSPFDLGKTECPVNCLFTNNSKLYSKSSAVIFFRSLRKPPPLKLNHQKWAFFTNESPVNIGPISTSKAWEKATSQLDWILSYRPRSDMVVSFGKLVRNENTNLNYSQIFSQKTKDVAWLASNCETHSLRERYVKELQKYINVDIYGKCGTKNCPMAFVKENDSTVCKATFSTEYKFYLSFENSLCDDYVTEKVYGIYHGDNMLIPVVRGPPNIASYLPPGTYISTSDFKSPRQLAEYLRDVGSSEEKFTSILKEKHKFKEVPWVTNYRTAICNMCKKLHSPSMYKGGNVYRRLLKDKCYTPHDIVT